MIITRTPLRISLGGGGTDLPAYYRDAGDGFLVAAAISKFVYIAVNDNFGDDILLKYSSIERVPAPAEIQHPLLREALAVTGVDRGVEISSMADIPTGTGLGSSGAFTVGVLRALWAHRHETVPNVDLARQACEIEMDRLGEPVGKQDQYIAALGGLRALTFRADETVDAEPLDVSLATRQRLDDDLLLFYTGIKRGASEVLDDEQRRIRAGDLRGNLDAVKQLGLETRAALEAGDHEGFGALLTRQWEHKHERQPGGVHDRIDRWIAAGIDAGAVGGKLVGAGGGGFLLFYAEAKASLRDVMAQHGLAEVRFSIDYAGSTTIAWG